jgi:hypothetical protein
MLDTLNTLVLIAFGLAILSILLGFIALLTQRIYLDVNTQKPVDIDIPLLGKMKTNYPALVFVFLGFFLAFYVLEKQLPPKEKKEVDWDIVGTFTDPEINDWHSGGELRLVPEIIMKNVDPNGRFRISIPIVEGTSFEDKIEKIHYEHRDGQVIIYPRKEYSAKVKNETCNLEEATSHVRTYRPIPLQRTTGK